MIRVEQLTMTVSIEGDAEAGERAFARLFDKYSRIQAEKDARERSQAGHIAQARSLRPEGRR